MSLLHKTNPVLNSNTIHHSYTSQPIIQRRIYIRQNSGLSGIDSKMATTRCNHWFNTGNSYRKNFLLRVEKLSFSNSICCRSITRDNNQRTSLSEQPFQSRKCQRFNLLRTFITIGCMRIVSQKQKVIWWQSVTQISQSKQSSHPTIKNTYHWKTTKTKRLEYKVKANKEYPKVNISRHKQ